MPVSIMDRLHMNPAELKVLILFTYSVIFAVVGLIAFTIGAHDADIFVSELTTYFVCEAAGSTGSKVCEKNFSVWRAEIMADLTWILLGLYPTVNLIYVVNVRDIKKIASRWWNKNKYKVQSTKLDTEYLS